MQNEGLMRMPSLLVQWTPLLFLVNWLVQRLSSLCELIGVYQALCKDVAVSLRFAIIAENSRCDGIPYY